MNKKVILAVIVLIVLALGAYFLLKKQLAGSITPVVTREQTTTLSSLKDLISKGVAQSCTFSNEDNSGTVYISSGKVKEDFETKVDGKTVKSHMIVDGNTSYVWSDGSKNGVKMTFDTASASPSAQALTAPMNYKCGVWVVDSSIFTLPTEVQFTSFGSNPTSGSDSSQCSLCDSVTGDSKTRCLTALKCN